MRWLMRACFYFDSSIRQMSLSVSETSQLFRTELRPGAQLNVIENLHKFTGSIKILGIWCNHNGHNDLHMRKFS